MISSIEFLKEIEPHLHGIIRRHCPGYSDDGLVTYFTGRGDEIHNLLQTTPTPDGFWEECLGCTAAKILNHESNS